MSVKGGGGVPPKSVTFFLAKILSVKGGGGTPLTDKIRKVVFEVLPKILKRHSDIFEGHTKILERHTNIFEGNTKILQGGLRSRVTMQNT